MMSDLQEGDGLTGDPNEDEQLTIRIPNPKVYMARQSLWIGRRGKPRCDHCRLNNLKCDRVLPACNHCSWTTGRECKYTPLPTPAHRGIPRCDRCRLNNLKCDRNLPVCNHCKDDDKKECNYTPKKRRKATSDNAQLSAERHSPIDMGNLPSLVDFPEEINFYGQNVASASISRTHGHPSSSVSNSSSPPRSHSSQTGRFTAELVPINRPMVDPSLSIPHHSDQKSLSTQQKPSQRVYIVPWNSPSFARLPDFMTLQLKSLSPVEFPDSTVFDEVLSTFLEGVMPELRETSCLTTESYAAVYRCLLGDNSSTLSPRMREWVSYHHLCPGSDLFHLILSPRETIYQAEDLKREALRRTYCSHVDKGSGKGRGTLDPYPQDTMEDADTFERLPVRNQLFDILTFAHIAHDTPPEMLLRIRKLGFASITWPMAELYTRLCPTCNFQGRQTEARPL